MHYIGNPFTIEDLEASGAKIKFNREAQMVASHLMLSGSIPRVHGWEQSESNFFIKKEEAYLPDHFEDDQSLFIQHKDGIIVLTGCGHAGIINILEHAVNCCGTEKILAVIGGLHLEGASSERIGLTVKFLRDFGVEKLIIGHCTGFEAMYSFRQAFGDSLIPLSVGKQIEF